MSARGTMARRGLAVAVVLLLAGQGAALATRSDPSARVVTMNRAAPPPPSTTTTEDPVTTTSPPTTAAAAPTTAAPRPVITAPRPTTTRRTAPAPAPPPPPPPAPNPGSITAAFYYGWYPSQWSSPGSHFHPAAGPYNSSDLATVKRQIEQMRYSGMQAAVASWGGQHSTTNDSFPTALRAADGTGFKWAIYYEQEGPGWPNQPPDQLRASLQFLVDHYMHDPNYLTIGGRPVIFVWPDPSDGCDMVQRWRQANTLGLYVVQKRFDGYAACEAQADSWHEYSPNLSSAPLQQWSFSVSPGFWRYDEATPRLARDPARFDGAVKAMAAANVQWKLVTTFNEYGEGTAVEPAQEWSSPSGYGVYIDILHKYLGSR